MSWTFTCYLVLLALVGAERLLELRIAKSNESSMAARGGVEHGREHYPWMVFLHSSLFLICPLEAWLLGRPWIPSLAALCLLLLASSMGLRYWVIRTLGDRWTTRIMVVPGEAPVVTGPFRLLRHPNYLAVVVELIALPLIHTAWCSAIVLTLGNAAILYRRIHAEEQALTQHGGYDAFMKIPRLLPRPSQGGKRAP